MEEQKELTHEEWKDGFVVSKVKVRKGVKIAGIVIIALAVLVGAYYLGRASATPPTYAQQVAANPGGTLVQALADGQLQQVESSTQSILNYLNAGIQLGVFPSGAQLNQIAQQRASSTQK